MRQNLAITYTKAVGIMLRVLAHCSKFWLLDQLIHAFHMPLFFIFSGFCFKEKYLYAPIKFVQKRIRGLWWPYVKWGLFFLTLHNVFFYLNIYNNKYGYNGIVQHIYDFDEFLNRAQATLLMTKLEFLLGGYWFLMSLFWGSLIGFCVLLCSYYFAKITKLNDVVLRLIGGTSLLIICLVTNYIPQTFTVFLIGPREFMAAIFFLVGHGLAKNRIPRFNWWQSILAFCVVIVNSFFYQISAADIFSDFRKVVPYIITAVMGAWCVYSLPWQKLKGDLARIMEYVGNNTLTILTWHFLCFKIISLAIILINDLPIERLAEFPVVEKYTNRGWFVLYFVVGVGLPLFMTYQWEKVKAKIKNLRSD